MNINLNVNSTPENLPACTSIEDMQVVTCEDAHLLKSYLIHTCPHKHMN